MSRVIDDEDDDSATYDNSYFTKNDYNKKLSYVMDDEDNIT
jgi:hypothetical protein